MIQVSYCLMLGMPFVSFKSMIKILVSLLKEHEINKPHDPQKNTYVEIF